MLFEWNAQEDQLSFRLEYDTDCFSEEIARLVSNLLTGAPEVWNLSSRLKPVWRKQQSNCKRILTTSATLLI